MILFFTIGFLVLLSGGGFLGFVIVAIGYGVLILIGKLCGFISKNLPSDNTKSSKWNTETKQEKGRRYEIYISDKLRQGGFSDVRVTQSSGDFGADVLCKDKNGFTYAVQCKNYSSAVGVDAVQEAYTAKAYYQCDRAVVITTDHFTQAAVEMASKTGVILIHGDGQLYQFMKRNQ